MKIPVQAQVIKKLYDNSFDDLRIKYGLTMNEIMFLLYLDKNKANNTASEIVENLVRPFIISVILVDFSLS